MRGKRKNSFIETLSNSSVAFNIIVFAASELIAAITVSLRFLTPWRTAYGSHRNGAWDDKATAFAYRSAEMERRQNGISDRRRPPSVTSKFFAGAGKSERRRSPDRRADPWDLHPA